MFLLIIKSSKKCVMPLNFKGEEIMSGISLKKKNFIDGMRLFEEDRKVDPEFIMDTLKEAIAKTYQKHIDAPEAMVRVDH